MLYKAVLLEDLPNFAWIVGYTNASWTLKADLAADYVCRLIRHMDAHDLGVAVARDVDGCKLADESVMGNLNAGYIRRGGDAAAAPGRQGAVAGDAPLPVATSTMLGGPIDDGVLVFEPRRHGGEPAGPAAGGRLAA